MLETPAPQNPFASDPPPPGAETCFDLGGRILSAFGPGAESCTVKPGTKIFVVAWSAECSTFEGDGATEAELRACALRRDRGITAHTVAVDGNSVPVSEVETGLLKVRLPEDNIFMKRGADRSGLSVAHGWVTLLHPLPPGTHTIEIHIAGTGADGKPVDPTSFRTTIVVRK